MMSTAQHAGTERTSIALYWTGQTRVSHVVADNGRYNNTIQLAIGLMVMLSDDLLK